MDKIIRKFVICDVRKLHNHYEKIFEPCRNQFQTWLLKSLNKFLLISQALKTLSSQDPLVTSLDIKMLEIRQTLTNTTVHLWESDYSS